MERQPDYWAGWKDGWAAATNTIFAAQTRALGSQPQPQPAQPPRLEAILPEVAGNKPGQRRRGRPPKSATLAAPPPRKRGRPPKNRPA